MKKFIAPISAIAFFIVSVFFIASHTSFQFLFPAQQVELSHGVQYGAVLKNFLFVQEITTKKRFISRIDLYMAKLPSRYANDNVFLLLDEQRRILYTSRFSSEDFGEALYFPFDFKKNFEIGKGKKIYACIYSIDGEQSSYIGLARKENSNLGKLYVLPIVNGDILQSFENQQSTVGFKGSIGARTFESDTRFFSLLQVFFYLLAFAVALFIFYIGKMKMLIRKSHLVPEYYFLGISLLFGGLILLVTPPFMVPDEPSHFFRAYQIAELKIFKKNGEVPASLVQLADSCSRMKFSTHEKTTRDEILSLATIGLEPGSRTHVETTNYTLPYIPQAIGIFTGKILMLNPLWLLYLGRLFNLLCAVLLVFLAIRTTPLLKWVFFLLGVMPMTLFQFSSLSYDALTIGLSFLLMATILNDALNKEKQISTRDLLVLFLLSGSLALAKPPYFLIAFTYLIIPVSKIGSLKKFILVYIALIATVLIMAVSWDAGQKIFGELRLSRAPSPGLALSFPGEESIPAQVPKHFNQFSSCLPLLPHVSGASEQDGQVTGSPAVQPSAQKQFILDNPVKYCGILFDTFFKSSGSYMQGFVGLFGWVDTPLPPPLSYVFWFMLLIVTLGIPNTGTKVGLLSKVILFALFLAGAVLIETAMYLYCNPVGSDSIIAVQGRYFIAFAPLLFLIIADGTAAAIVQKMYSAPSGKAVVKSPKQKQVPPPVVSVEMLLPKALPWLAILIAVISLGYSLFLLLERFYVIAI